MSNKCPVLDKPLRRLISYVRHQKRMTYKFSIRAKRQVTLPELLLREVGIGVGDAFVAVVENKKIILNPKKQAALDAFKALQKAFQESGIPESEFQDAIRKDREEYARKNFPDIYRH